jgi:signal transduction histidine kinase
MSLRAVLLLDVIAPPTVMSMAFGFIGLRLLENQVERRMQEDVELVARAIEPALSRALEQGRADSMRQALEAAFSIDRVYGAYVYDARGAQLAGASQQGPRLGAASSGEISRVAEDGDQVGEYGDVSGQPVYSFFVPLTDAGARIVGVLQVTRRASDFESYIQRLRILAAGFALLTISLMSGLVLYGHHRAIGKHLGRIIGNMRDIGAGARERRTPPSGPKEIAHVADALNTMLDSIERQEGEIARQQRARLELQEKLQRSAKLAAIGQLAAGIAHELGAPLSVIDGKAQRLLRADPEESIGRPLGQIRGEVRRMERTVEQLLDFGRGYTINLRRAPAEQIARAAVATLERDGNAGAVPIELSGPHPSPGLLVDPFRMEQALVNLLKNAVQASSRHPVRLSWFERGTDAGFEVEDDGPGIPESDRAHLFEPFFTTKRPGQGTGLGLAVVYRIVKEHGGSIEVETSSMGGALFRVVAQENLRPDQTSFGVGNP